MAKRIGKQTTADGDSGNVTASTFNEFYSDYVSALDQQATAGNKARAVLKRAKAAGINIKALRRARTEQRMDRDELISEQRALDVYRKFMRLPVGAQPGFDLAAAEDAADASLDADVVEFNEQNAGRRGRNASDEEAGALA